MDSKKNNFENGFWEKIVGREESVQKLILETKKFGKKTGKNIDLRNICQTATHKLKHNIIPQFKRAGVDFSDKSEVGKAVIKTIERYTERAQGALKQYVNIINSSNQLDNNNRKSDQDGEEKGIKTISPISKVFNNIKRKLIKFNKRKIYITPEALENANACIDEYEDLEEQMSQYTIQSNIIEELVEIICPRVGMRRLPKEVPELVDKNIAPDLMRLGLGYLIPKLEQRLDERYREVEAKKLVTCKENERDLFIPNFQQYREEKKKREAMISQVENSNIKEENGVEPGED